MRTPDLYNTLCGCLWYMYLWYLSTTQYFFYRSKFNWSGYSTVETSKTKPVKKSIAEVGQNIPLRQQSFRPSAGNVLILTLSDVSLTTSTFKTERLETAKEFIQQKGPTFQNSCHYRDRHCRFNCHFTACSCYCCAN